MKLFVRASASMRPKLEVTLQWIMLAEDDLRLAQFILDGEDPICWAAAFHAQQCAEKALKGFLTFHDIRAGKIHSIVKLLELCSQVLSEFMRFKDSGEQLSVYAVDSRYPQPFAQLSKQEAKDALESTRSIYEFVLKSLPDLEKD